MTIPDPAPAIPREGAPTIQSIEINFAVPVIVSEKDYRTLVDVIEHIARDNTPDGCVHWLSGMGSRPILSRADLRFMGQPDNPDMPESGEPTFDDSVLSFETCCREK